MIEIDTETAIIGGGQTGVPLARALAAAGRDVVLLEREHLGGSCVNFGCTPSKALIASARLAADARRAGTMGIRIPQVEVDLPAVMARVRAMVAQAKGDLDATPEQDSAGDGARPPGRTRERAFQNPGRRDDGTRRARRSEHRCPNGEAGGAGPGRRFGSGRGNFGRHSGRFVSG
jgi:choline dehydrogenase-like flavoprotein